MRYFTLILILLQLFACNDKQSNWENPEFSELDYEPNTLKIEKYSINGVPLKTDKETLLAEFGEPEEIIEQKNINISPTDSIDFRTFKYMDGHLVFNNFQDSFSIDYINFRNSNITIRAGEHELSSATKFRDIKEIFPDSYAWRNPGLSLIYSLVVDNSDIEISSFNHIHVSDGELLNGEYGFIEMAFVNGQLAALIYSHQFEKPDT